ncbi:MAG TPA: DUF6055 domain-containing protein, partial [Polyangiales bacterium]|nr:DUF6055 domain-containing protein [Polyangiales bacterium]
PMTAMAGRAAQGGDGATGAAGKAGSAAGSGAAGARAPGECDPGTTSTEWATNCPTAPPAQCMPGTWKAGGPDPDHAGYKLLSESEHFAVYSDESPAGAQGAVDHLELVWKAYFGSPMFMKEPLCDSSNKIKASIHVHSDFGLTGGSWASGRMGMWIGTGGLKDHWGLAHEFAHGVQAVSGGLSCGGSANYCGWIHESHANFMAHQLAEYRSNMHCSEMLFNAPHLYLGSTRDRYCNWQFMEFLKDKHCFSAVNAIWNSGPSNDPFTNIMKDRKWSIDQANDFFGEWAMHNVSWDYKDSEPIVSGTGGNTDPAQAFRGSYGPITDTSKTERQLRLTRLESLDADFATNRRFVSPYYWAPQRYGYNVVRLHPDASASSIGITFRGVTQDGASSDWRWGLVATTADMKTTRYSGLQRGADSQLEFCVNAGEQLWLVVMGTPSSQQQINWDQAYTSIYRYPYMVQLDRAWPDGFQGGARAECPSGTTRVANGGGCGPSGLPASVYVGPYAAILGGSVSGNARIEDQARVISGTVSGGTIGALSIIGSKSPPYNANAFNVSGTATTKTTFYPLGFFEGGQSIAGNATLYGDVEFRGASFSMSSGSYSGIVSSSEHTAVAKEVTQPPPYAWRP